jgi:L-fuculose-phosphate aldolase
MPADSVIAAARAMLRDGLTTGTIGNVSTRIGGDRMLITPTRRYPEDLGPADLVDVHLDDDRADERASQEWRMHAAIYRSRPDVGAVVHTHSPHAVARSFDPRPLIVETEEHTYLGLRCIRVVAPAPAGTTALAASVAATLGHERAVLLAHHGVAGTGADPRDALALCAAVEHQALIDHARRVARALEQPTEEIR